MGQQPLQQMVPQQQGVKALYCLQQMVAQLQQQKQWKSPQAEARLPLVPSRTRPRAAAVSSFFMVCELLS
jgi:hypothetical protein